VDHLGGLVRAPARKAGDLDSNPGPGENCYLKLTIHYWINIVNFIFYHDPKERNIMELWLGMEVAVLSSNPAVRKNVPNTRYWLNIS
jgi:hypothetical protein